MTLESMTGFSRASSQQAGIVVAWELKSVNGKSLEIRLRLPPGLERLEQPARQVIQRRLSRGNVQAALAISRSAIQQPPVVNEAFLRDLAGLAKRLEKEFGCRPASADGLLALRGVLDVPEASQSEDDRAAFDAGVVSLLEGVVADLESARRQEGEALGTVLAGHLDEIEKLTLKAEKDPSREPAAIRARLADHVRLLMEAVPAIDEDRLAAEAAFLATKADIREEIDRLKTHIASARGLLHAGGPVGRKLDFLSQEFNRESNTLCSKSNAATVTAIGLELKAAVDRFREQVQNLE